MGLDMTLTRKTRATEAQTKALGKEGKTIEIVEEVIYWRKANQIHNWFNTHTDREEDNNGGDTYVSRDQLEKLQKTVNAVLASCEMVDGKIENGKRMGENGWEPILEDGKYIKDTKIAETLLPNVEGFFFGSQHYDQYYILDLESTKEALEKELEEVGFCDYYYNANW